MSVVTLEEAQAKLPELVAALAPGEELCITCDNQPVAKLIGTPPVSNEPRRPGSAVGKLVILEDDGPQPQFGSAKGKLIIVSDDDEHLKDFAEYM